MLNTEPAFARCLLSVADDHTLLVRAKCGTRVEWVEVDLNRAALPVLTSTSIDVEVRVNPPEGSGSPDKFQEAA